MVFQVPTGELLAARAAPAAKSRPAAVARRIKGFMQSLPYETVWTEPDEAPPARQAAMRKLGLEAAAAQ
ncbi:hypothetical protein GCM10009429_24100 [Dyella marensis]